MSAIAAERPLARLVPEMEVCQGSARIDLASIGQGIDGYEIKGDRDDLARLPAQAASYGRVFDRLTLVASSRHLREAERVLPGWWGLALVRDDSRCIESVRAAGGNPELDPGALVRLLWRDEALAAVEARLGRQPRTTRRELCTRLVDLMPQEELRNLVCRSLRERATWRAAC